MQLEVLGKASRRLGAFCREDIFFFLRYVLGAALFICLAADAHAASADLQHFVDMGKMPPGIARQIDRSGIGEIILTLDESDASTLAKELRKSLKINYDNDEIVAAKANIYRQKKHRVLAGLAQADFSLLEDYDNFPVMLMTVNEHALVHLLNLPEVKFASENSRNIPYLAESLPLIEQPQTEAAGATGAGTAVAVLDTGVNYTLSTFGSCTAPGVPASCKVAYAQDFAPDDAAMDDSGHGTNVAGIVVGVAPDAKVLALDVFRAGGYALDSDIISALSWVLANRTTYNTRAVNMSLGSVEGYSSPCSTDGFAAPIQDLKAAGIATVAASGNEAFTDAIGSPACVAEAISVGAVYDSDVGSKIWCTDSSCSATLCTDSATSADKVACFSNSSSELTMLAPGSVITAAGISMSGTSQAAPHVAGAVAVINGVYGSLGVDGVIARLTSGGVPVLDPRNGLTKPRLNLYAAVFPDPLIGFSPASLTFNEIGNGKLAPSQTLNVANYGSGTLNWTAMKSASWLSVNPAAGVNSTPVTVGIASAALTPGIYADNIILASPDAPNSPQTVPVTLTVFDPQYSDGFESGDLTNIPWATGGAGAWTAQNTGPYSGAWAIKSPAMGDSSTSYLEVKLNICTSGYAYFWLKTSTEPQWDNLKFRVDGVNEGPFYGWSGETAWTQARSEHLVSAGLHTFRWEYSKDSSISAGSDAVWLDDIVLPPFNLPVQLASSYYNTIQSAYSAAVDGSVIKTQSYPFSQNIEFNRNISATLDGGYDCQYTSTLSSTYIDGSLTISSGTLSVNNLVIN